MSKAAWPTEIWTHQGTKPFPNPDPQDRLERRLGFKPGDQFTGGTKARITHGADVAQIVDSNLFKVAAGATGVDWGKFRRRLMRNEGMDEAVSKRVFVKDSKDGKTKWINRAKWEGDQREGRYEARFTKTDEHGNKIDYGDSRVLDDDGKFKRQDWGKTDSGVKIDLSGEEKKKLDKMQKWLMENEKEVSRSKSDVWDNPPSGHDYGFDNDNLWEALGIDPSKPPPEAPHLNVDYEYNLLAPRESHFNIPVPEGYGFGDHPGTRSGSWVHPRMESSIRESVDQVAIPMAGARYPGGAHTGERPFGYETIHHEGFTPTSPRAGQTTPMVESQYQK